MPSGTRMATICHHDHGIGRNKGRVPAVLMADSARALHIRPWLHTSNDDGLNGVRGGECWPHPNDMHTDEHRPQRQTLDRISRTCTRRVARREACSVRRTLCCQRDATPESTSVGDAAALLRRQQLCSFITHYHAHKRSQSHQQHVVHYNTLPCGCVFVCFR